LRFWKLVTELPAMTRRLAGTRSFFLAVAPLASFLSGCLVDQAGVLNAERMGDLTNPAATRVSASAEMIAGCGGGETGADALGLVRAPYLQQVSTRSALVTWTSTSEDAARVELSRPDGTQLGTFTAEVGRVEPHNGARPLSVRVDSLEPDSVYCYEIRGQGQLPLVARTGFRTAPEAGRGAAVRFIAFGDSGTNSEDQHALAAQMATVPRDLFLPLGDNAYGQGSYAEFEENFFPVYDPLFRSLPVVPVSGNHEYETDGAEPFRSMFALPENGGEAGRERWFSFDRGDVHFVGLDTEQVGEAQRAWLEADLATTTQPWKIVYTHKPPYSSGEHGSDAGVREAFAPIFARHGVSLVLSGHDHDYERSSAQDGVVYVVSGGGGKGVRGVGVSDFTAFSLPVIHFVYVEVKGRELALHAIDGAGTEFDSLVLRR